MMPHVWSVDEVHGAGPWWFHLAPTLLQISQGREAFSGPVLEGHQFIGTRASRGSQRHPICPAKGCPRQTVVVRRKRMCGSLVHPQGRLPTTTWDITWCFSCCLAILDTRIVAPHLWLFNIQSYSIPVANHLGIILHHPYRVTPNNKYSINWGLFQRYCTRLDGCVITGHGKISLESRYSSLPNVTC